MIVNVHVKRVIMSTNTNAILVIFYANLAHNTSINAQNVKELQTTEQKIAPVNVFQDTT